MVGSSARALGWLGCSVVLLVLSARSAAAQPAGAVTLVGELKATDPPDPLVKGSRHKAHEVELRKGQVYLVELRSIDFETALRVEDATGRRLGQNGGIRRDERDSRLGFVPPLSGKYRLVVTSRSGQPGEYLLWVQPLQSAGPLRVVQAKLTKESRTLQGLHYARYKVPVQPGQWYLLDLVSEELDPHLALRDPKGKILAQDDNGGEGQNARLLWPAGPEALWFVQVTAARPGSTGASTLRLQPFEAPPERTWTPRERLSQRAAELNHRARETLQAGKPADGIAIAREGLKIRQQLYPRDRFPFGHVNLTNSLNILGDLLRGMGRPAEAVPYCEQAAAMLEQLYPKERYPQGHSLLATSLNNLGVLLGKVEEPDRALAYLERALAMRERLYPRQRFPAGHPLLAASLQNLGVVFNQRGEADRAVGHLERALAMREQLYPAERFPEGHRDLAMNLSNLGFLLRKSGEHTGALRCLERGLAMSERLYPTERFPAGHPELALAVNNLGELLMRMGQHRKALSYIERALAMRERLYPRERYPEGHPALAASLSNLGLLLAEMGEYRRALAHAERALAMRRQLFPKERFPGGHPVLALGLTNLGTVLQKMGDDEAALPYQEQALAMDRRLYPPARCPRGHPDLASSLNNLGMQLHARGEYARALPHLEEALAMRKRLHPRESSPRGHPALAQSLNNLGMALGQMGEHDRALPYFEQALAMRQRLFPKERFPRGHPCLMESLNNLGAVFEKLGNRSRAVTYDEQALAMNERLYPKDEYPAGHPLLAQSLNNLGALLLRQGQDHERAGLYLKQSLAMREKLYPRERFPGGHPKLAESLNNLGALLQAQGRPHEALASYERSLEIREGLYPRKRFPRGHRTLAGDLSNLGFLLGDMGEHGKAAAHFERTLAMYRAVGEEFAASAAEAQALKLLQSFPLARDGYLSLPTGVSAADAYARIWRSRALLTRLLQRRHQATRIALAGSEPVRRKWQELLDTRSHLARLLLQPGPDRPSGTKEVTGLTDRKEALERELAALLPEIERGKELDRLGPGDLAVLFPKASAFVDLIRYTYFGKGIRTARYAAFVVLPDRTVKRIELGEAAPTDEAVRAWREKIATERDTLADAARVGKRLWVPLAKALPAGTTTVYLAPDSVLARLPWAALPGSKPGTVLLEEMAVAVVPHGPFLLEQLKYPPRYPAGKEGVVALGGVDYGPAGKGSYAPLPGTEAEARLVAGLAGPRGTTVLDKDRATWEALKVVLPQARYAHLATHGFFDARAVLREYERLRRLRKEWEFRPERTSEFAGAGTRSPLSYTGLVLAGANDPRKSKGGVVTGEALVELPLEGLRLCVLSACETGLGWTDGEGVQGLQRAFHLAGCPNVVCSLWNVNDRATAALMARFYHGLWAEGKPPLEALRQAQLTVLRHPERIADLADRGRPRFGAAVRLPADARPEAARAATRLWAAFVLSGVGD